ncbi:MAG: peptidase, partial [Candidatus Cloacimonetes bacterium]|nr:peptidase [Candidatus Cloacimonadota bacterium]
LLEKLNRKIIGYGEIRWSKEPGSYPDAAVAGPMVAITNEFAGSDGDIFSHSFKLMKLGKLIGKRTWGGVIGINGQYSLVDGSITTQPEYSFWFKDVGWGVENYGTDPDIEIEILPKDYVQNTDPQLDKGIELLLDELKKNPVKKPKLDKRPDLSLPKLLKRK